MPRKGEKSLFADLGRPTLRGIRKCHKCGTINGTRGNCCKNKNCDVVFRGMVTTKTRKTGSLDASQLSNLPGFNEKVYSVRIKERGPDYRNFVQEMAPDNSAPVNNATLKDSRPISSQTVFKCFIEACNKSKDKKQNHCKHIQAVQNCTARSQRLEIKRSVISSTARIPQPMLETILRCLEEPRQLIVERVSTMSFVTVVKNNASDDKNSIDFMHTMFIKTSKNEMSKNRQYYCSCFAAKSQDKEEEVPRVEMCLHYYACICAFYCNEVLMDEFEHFIIQATPQVTIPPQPLHHLNHLHLVTTESKDNERKTNELPDSSLSVEMTDLALLESITVENQNLTHTTLERVLSDQIVVTSVDNTLTFGDSTVLAQLDRLDENTEQRVTQMFVNSTESIELVYPSLDQSETEFATPCPSPAGASTSDTQDKSTTKQDCSYEQMTLDTIVIVNQPERSQKFSASKQNNSTPSKLSTDDQAYWGLFELWLSGVNERINATMSYILPEKPEPLIYYIPTAYFEYLKERLLCPGNKKRRLPNQTLVFHRTDRAPIGTFTKHIWKITNILHVLNIFQCQSVSLKTKQYFTKSTNGNFDFDLWIPPEDGSNEDERKNQRILPVLHSTQLKCGRNYPSPSKESTPFIIEWIPEIFQESKLGELTLRFEFIKNEPSKEVD